MKPGARVETLRTDVVFGDGQAELIDVTGRSNTLRDLDHMIEKLGADALPLKRRKHGQRQQVGNDLLTMDPIGSRERGGGSGSGRPGPGILGVEAQHREASPAAVEVMIDPREDARLLQPRGQDAGVVPEVVIGLSPRGDYPRVILDLRTADHRDRE